MLYGASYGSSDDSVTLRPRPRVRLSWGRGRGTGALLTSSHSTIPEICLPAFTVRVNKDDRSNPVFPHKRKGLCRHLFDQCYFSFVLWSLPYAQWGRQGETFSVVEESCHSEELRLNLALMSHCSEFPIYSSAKTRKRLCWLPEFVEEHVGKWKM